MCKKRQEDITKEVLKIKKQADIVLDTIKNNNYAQNIPVLLNLGFILDTLMIKSKKLMKEYNNIEIGVK